MRTRNLALFGVVTGASIAAGATAAAVVCNTQVRGSDTLAELVTSNTVFPAPLTYIGSGSGNGETALVSGVQFEAPMSRALTLTVAFKNSGFKQRTFAADGVSFISAPTGRTCKTTTADLLAAYGGAAGAGTTAACNDPVRDAALQRIKQCDGLINLTSTGALLRRDDCSGTTDVFKTKTNIVQFCNNAGVPNSSPPNLCTAASPGPTNVSNGDGDPKRVTCPASSVCTAYAGAPAGKGQCALQSGTTPVPCNLPSGSFPNGDHSLVVTLSQADPSTPSDTAAIGSRVSHAQLSKDMAGYVGLSGTIGTFQSLVNNTGPSVDEIRANAYALSRGLFINERPDVTCDSGLNAAYTTGRDNLYNCTGLSSTIRSKITAAGFINCMSSCAPVTISNICRVALLDANIGTSCTTTGGSCSNAAGAKPCCNLACTGAAATCGCVANGTAPGGPSSNCCSGAVDGSGNCAALPVGAACDLNVNCASGNCAIDCPSGVNGCTKGSCI